MKKALVALCLALLAIAALPPGPAPAASAAGPDGSHTLVEGSVTELAPAGGAGVLASSVVETAQPTVRALSVTRVRASWYGAKFYGRRTACGQTYMSALRGVAHRTLPCGTPVTLRYRDVTVTVPVVDRGPYVFSREFDLTHATRVALGCPDICYLSWLR